MITVEGKFKKPLLISSIVVGLLLIAGITYVVMAYLNIGKPTSNSSQTVTKNTPTEAKPENIQQALKTTNSGGKQTVENHNKAKTAIDEQQTVLVQE